MGDVQSRNIGNRNIVRHAFLSIHCWSAAMSSPPNFLISFFSPINFTYCKVDNYAFNYQIAIVKLTEKPFYGVG